MKPNFLSEGAPEPLETVASETSAASETVAATETTEPETSAAVETSIETSVETSTGRPIETPAERPSGKAAERTSETSAERPTCRPTGKADGKADEGKKVDVLELLKQELAENQLDKLPVPSISLPPILRQVVQNAPTRRKVHAFVAALSPLCALCPRVRLQYPYDARRSALLLQVLVEGQQSSGKSFCADINELIMGAVIRKDQEQRRLEQEYREKKSKRKANEPLEDPPLTTIRVIPANISKTVLVKRADYYQRVFGDTLTFWMFSEELAQVVDAGRQGFSNLRTIMRTAYDLGSYFGIDFQSDTSYSAIVDINICSLFCCTPSALNKYMDKASIEGGNVTRTILCPLDDEIGSAAAVFTPYSESQLQEINDTIECLEAKTFLSNGFLAPQYLLNMTWLTQEVERWTSKKGHRATLSGSAALDIFRKRSSVSAFRVAALCYYLYEVHQEVKIKRGQPRPSAEEMKKMYEKWQRNCKKIYVFMADYILNNMLRKWGSLFEEMNEGVNNDNFELNSQNNGLFFDLPDTFSREDLRLLCEKQKVRTRPRQFLYVWTKNRDIVAITRDLFKKVPPKKS